MAQFQKVTSLRPLTAKQIDWLEAQGRELARVGQFGHNLLSNAWWLAYFNVAPSDWDNPRPRLESSAWQSFFDEIELRLQAAKADKQVWAELVNNHKLPPDPPARSPYQMPEYMGWWQAENAFRRGFVAHAEPPQLEMLKSSLKTAIQNNNGKLSESVLRRAANKWSGNDPAANAWLLAYAQGLEDGSAEQFKNLTALMESLVTFREKSYRQFSPYWLGERAVGSGGFLGTSKRGRRMTRSSSRRSQRAMKDIHRCVICDRKLRANRTHVDTCSERCYKRLLAQQRASTQGLGGRRSGSALVTEGYVPCACRDCFDIAIGKRGHAICHECDASGCEPNAGECRRPDAYGVDAGSPRRSGSPRDPRATHRGVRGTAGRRQDLNDYVKAYYADKWTPEASQAARYALYDLYNGPMDRDLKREEGYPASFSFGRAVDILRDWWSDVGESLIVDTDAGIAFPDTTQARDAIETGEYGGEFREVSLREQKSLLWGELGQHI